MQRLSSLVSAAEAEGLGVPQRASLGEGGEGSILPAPTQADCHGRRTPLAWTAAR